MSDVHILGLYIIAGSLAISSAISQVASAIRNSKTDVKESNRMSLSLSSIVTILAQIRDKLNRIEAENGRN